MRSLGEQTRVAGRSPTGTPNTRFGPWCVAVLALD